MLDKDKRLFNRSQTSFFRDDIIWQEFGDFLKEHFQTLDDVDIHCFACSTGQEPYSLALLLKKYFDDSDFTIKASDIVADRIKGNILMQKSGILIDGFTFQKIHDVLGLDSKQDAKYFLPANSKSVQIDPKIVNCVEFSQKNILKSVEDFNSDKKTIIMCRNMWPYVDSDKYEEFAKKLYDKLAPGSIVVLGSYDYCGEKRTFENSDKFPKILFQCGFKPIERGVHFIHKHTPLIFEK